MVVICVTSRPPHPHRTLAGRHRDVRDVQGNGLGDASAGIERGVGDRLVPQIRDAVSHRRQRWPHTANPHLIINKQTASNTRPISDNALTAPFRRRAATLETLRVDRQLDEALTHGADPLHLAVVFGLDETTAIRYSTAARKLLLTQGHNPPNRPEHP